MTWALGSTAPDYECPEPERGPEPLQARAPAAGNTIPAMLGYLLIGMFLGVVFVMSEVASWYRIQEMFRLHSLHLYGVIGSALVVSATLFWLIRRFGLRTLGGEPIQVAPKEWGTARLRGARYWIGGTLFGMGWALLGACPGPMFALVGTGMLVLLMGILAAMAGTFVYALVQGRLPH